MAVLLLDSAVPAGPEKYNIVVMIRRIVATITMTIMITMITIIIVNIDKYDGDHRVQSVLV